MRHPTQPASRLILTYAIAIGAFAGTTAQLALYLNARFAIDENSIGYVFFWIGAISVFARVLALGPLVDRHGARPLMAIGTLGLAGSLMLTSQVTELWQFVALQAFGVGMGLALVGPLTLNVTLSKWFGP